jgi:cytosine/adenosine deaminase-related metal-dependent hydrolase
VIQQARAPSGCWHRAGWVIQDPDTILQDAMIHVCKGRVTAVKTGRNTGQDPVVDHGSGVLMPALINAHTHLELGALKGRLPVGQGFATWVRHLIHLREKLSRKELETGILDGIGELLSTGCGAVGEISTLGLSRGPFLQSLLRGIWFREYIGNREKNGAPPEIPTDRESLAGHAPHTTAPDLLIALKQETGRFRLPFSIHLAESGDESEFIRSKAGRWADLLQTRGIDFSTWPLPAPSPVRYLHRLNVLDEKTLAVHLLQADHDDFRILSERGTSVAVCPRSNQRLHRQLPDLTGMFAGGLNICLGTDSPASCDSLSLFDEMAFTARHFPMLSPRTILEMATTNGARALGLEKTCGRLFPGSRADCLYLPLSATKPDDILGQIVTIPPDAPVERI